jgi:hypothetical protein
MLISVMGKNISGQSFEPPVNYELKIAADYTKYEKDVIDGALWLKETAFDGQTEKRKEVTAFLVAWINGSPTVNVEINCFIRCKNTKMSVLKVSPRHHIVFFVLI